MLGLGSLVTSWKQKEDREAGGEKGGSRREREGRGQRGGEAGRQGLPRASSPREGSEGNSAVTQSRALAGLLCNLGLPTEQTKRPARHLGLCAHTALPGGVAAQNQ